METVDNPEPEKDSSEASGNPEDESDSGDDSPGEPAETDEVSGSEVKSTDGQKDSATTKDASKTPKADPVTEEAVSSEAVEAPVETAPTAADLQAECDAKVSQIVAKMYILRSSYTGSLAGLAGQAYADYTAGVPKSTIVSNYMGQGYGLEAQCDASVGALMSELTGVLTQYGQPTDLVNTIYAAYESEKQYTKAYYMSLYLNN